MASGISNTFSLEYWENLWNTRKTPWQCEEVRNDVVKYYDQMTDKGELKRILVPLCGKTLEMKFLYERGHEVVGIDLSYKACKEFFQDNKIKFSEKVDEKSGAEHLLISEDLKIKLYQGELFKISKDHIGIFDAILDWNSFIAIDPMEREAYVELQTCLLKPTGRMLLNTFEYPRDEFSGPPCAISISEVEQFYMGKMKVEFLETISEGLESKKAHFKVSKISILIFLLTKL
ncbi:hypothetical protein LOD99_13796 [Oopsacas minuta]|uniref:thiopurine S-methyltransferase n=1 Tax=Oopsacas minuta TaxID=111878 RepID=A0AAV7KL61_9METZ|nr:hypothetical protein LOD99_13796 [Oopsacas minuta]